MRVLKMQVFECEGVLTAVCEGENGQTHTIEQKNMTFAEYWKLVRAHMKKVHDAD